MAVIDRVQMLSDTKLYLPDENLLSDALLNNIIDSVIANQIPSDDSIFRSEALCKTLKAAALLNKAKASVDTATLKREKVGQLEKEQFEGASRFSWDDYIKSLSDICPYLPGGGFRPSKAIGARINPSKPFIVDDCPCPIRVPTTNGCSCKKSSPLGVCTCPTNLIF